MATGKNYALITGASKGLGKAMALEMAKRKFDLLLVARSEKELVALALEIQKNNGVDVRILAIDLSLNDSAQQTLDWVNHQNLPVSVLINNAGFGLWGNFDEVSLPEQLNMCKLNMDALVSLCHLFLPLLKQQPQAYILNVSSTAAYQAVPTLGIYAATKAFVLAFTRALRFELATTHVSVSCLSPGAIDTGFAERAGLDPFSKMAQKFNMKPTIVAEIAINGMLARKAEIIPGFTNIISAYAIRFLPKSLIEKMAAGIYQTS